MPTNRPTTRSSFRQSLPKGHGTDIEELINSAGVMKKSAEFEKNAIIFSQGDPAKSVFYVKKGLVKLSFISHAGKQAVVAMFGPGDFFGTWCLANHPMRMATATAMEPTTVRVIDKSQMLHALNTKHALSDRFIAVLLKKNARIGRDLVNLLLNPAEKRLARALWQVGQYGRQDGSSIVLPRVSQQFLAEMVGIRRARVNFFMNKFRRLGLLEYDGDLRIRRSLLSVLLPD